MCSKTDTPVKSPKSKETSETLENKENFDTNVLHKSTNTNLTGDKEPEHEEYQYLRLIEHILNNGTFFNFFEMF